MSIEPKKIVRFILSMILAVVALFGNAAGVFAVAYKADCDKMTGLEKRVLSMCREDDRFSIIEYVNYLKTENNGYYDYHYFDLHERNGDKYFVEIRDLDDGTYEISASMKYSLLKIYRLSNMITYRSTPTGTMSDEMDVALKEFEK